VIVSNPHRRAQSGRPRRTTSTRPSTWRSGFGSTMPR